MYSRREKYSGRSRGHSSIQTEVRVDYGPEYEPEVIHGFRYVEPVPLRSAEARTSPSHHPGSYSKHSGQPLARDRERARTYDDREVRHTFPRSPPRASTVDNSRLYRPMEQPDSATQRLYQRIQAAYVDDIDVTIDRIEEMARGVYKNDVKHWLEYRYLLLNLDTARYSFEEGAKKNRFRFLHSLDAVLEKEIDYNIKKGYRKEADALAKLQGDVTKEKDLIASDGVVKTFKEFLLPRQIKAKYKIYVEQCIKHFINPPESWRKTLQQLRTANPICKELVGIMKPFIESVINEAYTVPEEKEKAIKVNWMNAKRFRDELNAYKGSGEAPEPPEIILE